VKAGGRRTWLDSGHDGLGSKITDRGIEPGILSAERRREGVKEDGRGERRYNPLTRGPCFWDDQRAGAG